MFARRPPIEYIKSFIMMPACFVLFFAPYNLFTFNAVMMLLYRFLSEFCVDCIHLQSADNGDWGGTRTHIFKRTVSPNTARD